MVSNLRSGVGDPGTHEFLSAMGTRDVEITLRFLQEGGTLENLLSDADSFDRVIVSGGDGTISSALYALRYTGVPVALYPAGTANLFARNLTLPNAPAELARLVFDGEATRLDLGELDTDDGRGFFVMAGVGFDAGLIHRAELDGKAFSTDGIAVVLVN